MSATPTRLDPLPLLASFPDEGDREDVLFDRARWLWDAAQSGASKLAEGRLHSSGAPINSASSLVPVYQAFEPVDRAEIARAAIEIAEAEVVAASKEAIQRLEALSALKVSLRQGCPISPTLTLVPRERWLPQSHWVPKGDGSGVYVAVWTGIEVRCDDDGRIWPGPDGPLTREAAPPACSPFEFDEDSWGR